VGRFICKVSIEVSPVTYDEGLRSYKAIAFIESLTRFYYCKLDANPPQNVLLAKQKTLDNSLNKIGEING
jgi:hypothetical protein